MNEFKVGSKVLIKLLTSKEIEGFDKNVGFSEQMRLHLGKEGTVLEDNVYSVDKSGKRISYSIQGPIGAWNWPPNCLVQITDTPKFKKGDKVIIKKNVDGSTFHPGAGWSEDMRNYLGLSGVIDIALSYYPDWYSVKVEGCSINYSWPASALELASVHVGAMEIHPDEFEKRAQPDPHTHTTGFATFTHGDKAQKNYDKVLYGCVVSFVRKDDGTTEIGFKSAYTGHVEYFSLYKDDSDNGKARALIHTLTLAPDVMVVLSKGWVEIVKKVELT
jgi:hypothetical protein